MYRKLFKEVFEWLIEPLTSYAQKRQAVRERQKGEPVAEEKPVVMFYNEDEFPGW